MLVSKYVYVSVFALAYLENHVAELQSFVHIACGTPLLPEEIEKIQKRATKLLIKLKK